MLRRHIAAVAAIVCVVASQGLAGDHIIDHNDIVGVASLPQATMDAIGQQTWFFTRASVGGNMLSGLSDLHAANATRYPLVSTAVTYDSGSARAANAPSSTTPGTVYQCDRSNPGWSSKCTIFANSVNLAGWNDTHVDIVMDKLCYIDQSANANTYLSSMAALEAAHPNTVFVYSTMPLTTDTDSNNVLRNQYNQTVRSYCQDNSRFLLDIADIEAHNAAGVEQTFTYNSQTWQRLCADYTTDGGHLNTLGRDQVALGWYAMAAEITTVPEPATLALLAPAAAMLLGRRRP